MGKLEELFKKYDLDAILLQNCDDFTLQHVDNSELTKITGFMGSAGEALVKKSGETLLFVDPRYHLQAKKQAKKGVSIVEMNTYADFFELLPKFLQTNSKILIDGKFITMEFLTRLRFIYNNIITGDFVKRYPPKTEYDFSKINMEKIKQFTKTIKSSFEYDNIFIAKPYEVSYLTELYDFDMPFSSSIRAKMIIKGDKPEFYVGEIPFTKGKTLILGGDLTVSDFEKFEKQVVLDKDPIDNLMGHKSKEEIENFKKVFKSTDLALMRFKKRIKLGLSETKLNEILNEEFKRQNVKGLSFKTILAIGENTASIHYSNYDSDKKLNEGDLLLVDCGAYLENGLASDITRVFAISTPTEKQKTVYTLVLKAFFAAYKNNSLKTGGELDNCARDILKDAPSSFTFPHALGHGISLNVHSPLPIISKSSKDKILPNMVFSIEPGLYSEKDFGVRLENAVYVDDKGDKISLSKFPFEENLINRKMLKEEELKWLDEWQKDAINEN